MHDIKWIRENPKKFDSDMNKRGLKPQSERLISLDEEKRSITSEIQLLQAERNNKSKSVGKVVSSGEDASSLIRRVSNIKDEIAKLEKNQKILSNEINEIIINLPNILDSSVPNGADELDNLEIRRYKDPTVYSFSVRDHVSIGEGLGGLNFDQASKIAGSRFSILSGNLARLNRAIAQFMLDVHVSDNGYTEISPPLLVNDDALFGTGQLPKFSDDLYKTQDNLWLIPTSEVSLTNYVSDRILSTSDLPMRLTALTPCFRREAGAAGKDTRGMIRQHQFDKVELVSIVEPDSSENELERMTQCAEDILKKLDLPYRVVILSSGDIGFSANKTYDIEVWLPGQKMYREISSCSNCKDFQALRLGARYRPKEGIKGTLPVHTLNGSALAVGRTLIAILENYQQENGDVDVPDALIKYMNGTKTINVGSSGVSSV